MQGACDFGGSHRTSLTNCIRPFELKKDRTRERSLKRIYVGKHYSQEGEKYLSLM